MIFQHPPGNCQFLWMGWGWGVFICIFLWICHSSIWTEIWLLNIFLHLKLNSHQDICFFFFLAISRNLLKVGSGHIWQLVNVLEQINEYLNWKTDFSRSFFTELLLVNSLISHFFYEHLKLIYNLENILSCLFN